MCGHGPTIARYVYGIDSRHKRFVENRLRPAPAGADER